MDPLIADEKKRMEATLENLRKELATIRTGTASPALLDHIRVEAYGDHMPINQLATVTAPDGRMLVVTPWDRANLGAIEKSILTSDVGLTPSSDGVIIRLQVPLLTEERRKELSKHVAKFAEETRVAIRNIRRDVNAALDKKEKTESLPEDEVEARKKEVQKMTDEYIKHIDAIAEAKAREIMTI